MASDYAVSPQVALCVEHLCEDLVFLDVAAKMAIALAPLEVIVAINLFKAIYFWPALYTIEMMPSLA